MAAKGLVSEGLALELRLEMFNVFNRAQFYGGNSVDGNIGDQGGTSHRNSEQRTNGKVKRTDSDHVFLRSSGFEEWWVD